MNDFLYIIFVLGRVDALIMLMTFIRETHSKFFLFVMTRLF